MKEHNGRSRARKKNLCIALMVALLIGEVSLLQGEAASPVQTGNESDSRAELSEEETESSVTEGIVMGSQESQKADAVDEIEEIEAGTLEIENSAAEASGADTLESDNSKTEGFGSENVPENIQRQDGLGKEISETESTEPEVQESDLVQSDIFESETFGSEEAKPDVQESKETEKNATQTALPDEEELGREEGLTSLQIPEKLEIIIDPWEIDERGQIYSEPFIVKNLGKAPGVLTLSFVYRAKGESGAIISETPEELRTSGEKLVYMKVAFQNGEEFVFTREGVQCEVELEPGEELTLWFNGEVNEYAEESWKSEGIEIEGIYSWKIEEIRSNETEDILGSGLDGTDDSEEAPADEAENIPPIEQNEEDGSEEASSDGAENILPIEQNEEDSREEAPSAGIEGEASEEESIPPVEPDEKSSSEEVPFIESTEEGIEENRPSENMLEE